MFECLQKLQKPSKTANTTCQNKMRGSACFLPQLSCGKESAVSQDALRARETWLEAAFNLDKPSRDATK